MTKRVLIQLGMTITLVALLGACGKSDGVSSPDAERAKKSSGGTVLEPVPVPPTTVPPTVPPATIPSTTVPPTTVPPTTVPSTTIPSTTVPSTTMPSTTVPPASVPEVPAATSSVMPNLDYTRLKEKAWITECNSKGSKNPFSREEYIFAPQGFFLITHTYSADDRLCESELMTSVFQTSVKTTSDGLRKKVTVTPDQIEHELMIPRTGAFAKELSDSLSCTLNDWKKDVPRDVSKLGDCGTRKNSSDTVLSLDLQMNPRRTHAQVKICVTHEDEDPDCATQDLKPNW